MSDADPRARAVEARHELCETLRHWGDSYNGESVTTDHVVAALDRYLDARAAAREPTAAATTVAPDCAHEWRDVYRPVVQGATHPNPPVARRCTRCLLTESLCCRGCGASLDAANDRLADGCPCNAPRGINHGLVPANVCTCAVCDAAQTGSVRDA